MKVKLNKRLQKVADLVEENKSIIDVGCDHAFLSIYLTQNKNPKYVIASDIKEGPLNHAKENCKKYQVLDKIKLKLGPGIEPIDNKIDTIIISGMGGYNMIGILKYKRDLYKNVDTIILSPNSDSDKVRKEICKLGFYIDEEVLVKENNIIYVVIRFKRGRHKYHTCDYLYGPVLIEKKDTLFLEYLEKENIRKQKLLEILPKKYIGKRIELKKDLRHIGKILKNCYNENIQ
mgnify:CR=1 FL=1